MKISLPLRLRAALIACVLALPILSTTIELRQDQQSTHATVGYRLDF